MSSRPYKQRRAYATQQYKAYNIIDDFINAFRPQTAEGVGTVGPAGIGALGKQALTDITAKGVGETIRQGQGGTTSLADPTDPIGVAVFKALDWINKDKKAPWVENVKYFFRVPVTVFPQNAYAQSGTNFLTPCRACIAGYAVRRTILGGCYCKQVSTTSTAPSKILNGAPGSRVTVSNPYACPYSGCTGLGRGSTCWNCRCSKLCGSRGVKQVLSDGSCYCKPASSSSSSSGVGNVATSQSTLNAGCSYSGCNGFTGMSRCSCRCSKICATKGGVERVATNGSCFCKGGTSGGSSGTGNVATSVSTLTSGCSYSGCNGFTGMSRCSCRCSKICSSKGGVERVASNGSCYCKGSSSSGSTSTKCPYSGCTSLNKGSSCFYCRCKKICGSRGVKTVTSNGSCYCKPAATSTSGGCSTYLKQRCGNFCAQRPGDPYLDSKCSCFCR